MTQTHRNRQNWVRVMGKRRPSRQESAWMHSVDWCERFHSHKQTTSQNSQVVNFCLKIESWNWQPRTFTIGLFVTVLRVMYKCVTILRDLETIFAIRTNQTRLCSRLTVHGVVRLNIIAVCPSIHLSSLVNKTTWSWNELETPDCQEDRLPVHVYPLPVYPFWQRHKCDGTVLIQRALALQLFVVGELHSFTSGKQRWVETVNSFIEQGKNTAVGKEFQRPSR